MLNCITETKLIEKCSQAAIEYLETREEVFCKGSCILVELKYCRFHTSQLYIPNEGSIYSVLIKVAEKSLWICPDRRSTYSQSENIFGRKQATMNVTYVYTPAFDQE